MLHMQLHPLFLIYLQHYGAIGWIGTAPTTRLFKYRSHAPYLDAAGVIKVGPEAGQTIQIFGVVVSGDSIILRNEGFIGKALKKNREQYNNTVPLTVNITENAEENYYWHFYTSGTSTYRVTAYVNASLAALSFIDLLRIIRKYYLSFGKFPVSYSTLTLFVALAGAGLRVAAAIDILGMLGIISVPNSMFILSSLQTITMITSISSIFSWYVTLRAIGATLNMQFVAPRKKIWDILVLSSCVVYMIIVIYITAIDVDGTLPSFAGSLGVVRQSNFKGTAAFLPNSYMIRLIPLLVQLLVIPILALVIFRTTFGVWRMDSKLKLKIAPKLEAAVATIAASKNTGSTKEAATTPSSPAHHGITGSVKATLAHPKGKEGGGPSDKLLIMSKLGPVDQIYFTLQDKLHKSCHYMNVNAVAALLYLVTDWMFIFVLLSSADVSAMSFIANGLLFAIIVMAFCEQRMVETISEKDRV
jgi:hypothetical protein